MSSNSFLLMIQNIILDNAADPSDDPDNPADD